MRYRIYKNARDILCAEIEGITLHSTRNPQKEARTIVERSFDTAPQGLVVVGGGLGYHLDALAKRFPELDIICLEPLKEWPDSVRANGITLEALCSRFYLANADWREDIRDCFYRGYDLFALESHRHCFPELISELEQLKNSFGNRQEVNRNTLKRFGSLWVRNLLFNFLRLREDKSIQCFGGSLRGIPALLLAGGPSLDEILPFLGEMKKKMVIVAVDTAIAACKRVGVLPDFVVAVDPQYWNTKHLHQMAGEPELPLLISESSACPRSFRLYPAAPYFFKSHFPLGTYFEEKLLPRDALSSGGSVATATWDFLRYAGVTRIYLAGLDMGFPGHLTHYRGSYFEEMITSEGRRLHPAEQAHLEYLYSGRPVYREDHSGEKLLSDQRMDVYCHWFESQFRNNPEIINSSLSRSSRRLRGAKTEDYEHIRQLKDLRPEIDRRLFAAKNNDNSRRIASPFIKTLLARLNLSLTDLKSICDHALQILEQLETRDTAAARRDELLDELDSTDKKILADGERRIAGFLIDDVMETLTTQKDPENFEQALERSRQFYSTLGEAAGTHMNLIKAVSNRVKNYAGIAEDF